MGIWGGLGSKLHRACNNHICAGFEWTGTSVRVSRQMRRVPEYVYRLRFQASRRTL
jgi:hypothetical protein